MRPKLIVFIVLFVMSFGVWRFFRSTRPDPRIEDDLRKYVPQEPAPMQVQLGATPQQTGSARPIPLDGSEYVPPSFMTSAAPNQGHTATYTASAPPTPTPLRTENLPVRGRFGGRARIGG